MKEQLRQVRIETDRVWIERQTPSQTSWRAYRPTGASKRRLWHWAAKHSWVVNWRVADSSERFTLVEWFK